MIENEVIAIVAMGKNREIGQDGKMLWHRPSDLQHFRNQTLGHFVVMGRTTFESLPIKPLPDRRNIVITQDFSHIMPYASKGWILACHCPHVVMRRTPGKVFIMGGELLYESTMSRWDKVILTRLPESYPEADTFFPKFEQDFNLDKEEQIDGLTYCYYSRKEGTGYLLFPE